MNKIAIFGAGGFAREVLVLLEDMGLADRVSALFESDGIWKPRDIWGIPTLPISRFEPTSTDLVLGVGDPNARMAMRSSLPKETRFPTLVHPGARIHRTTLVGNGVIVCEGCIVTCDIELGDHVNLDRLTTIGHDSRIGDFVTAAPATVVSGNCQIGSLTYLGTNSCVREKVTIAPGTTVGMGATVVSNIETPGIYVGTPAKRRPD
ncbi:NeuD/PglB/VioB family sugar acetyltransferase [Lysobacter arenosi]|uniref:NeuD/PglB/VioB family sugar acetyltransferase n=1 Tax=Lysobacter arenosi TaxID=2795387 RepID=A0ABX7R7Y3_9GAMM|nr:NeuD/PglB/VioB family sugar acetyltransferase [Lysobacter arenosi]QSX73633.1 NeuD/PglB/VioB family sugar acetyltransferase [Lysobacter arenosi]